MSNFTRKFWRDPAERTISSAAQGFLVGGGLGFVGEASQTVDARYLPWLAALGTAGGMAVATLAKCLAAIKVGDPDSAALRKGVE